MANYSIAQILAMEPRVRHSPTVVHPVDGSRRCLEPLWWGAIPGLAGLGWLQGTVSGTELADRVSAAKKRSTKKSQSVASRSSFVSYEQIAPWQRLWKC